MLKFETEPHMATPLRRQDLDLVWTWEGQMRQGMCKAQVKSGFRLLPLVSLVYCTC